MKAKAFIQLVRRDCRQCGVTFRVGRGRYIIENGEGLSGFYDGKRLVASRGRGRRHYLTTLVHEYNHMIQDLDGAQVWLNGERSKFAKWISNKRCKLSPTKAKKHCVYDALVEWDCERRTLAMIDDFELPLDKKKYTKTANAYIWSYFWQLKHRAWPKNTVYRVKAILDAVPDKLMSRRQVLSPPKKIIELMDKHLKGSKQ